MRRGILWGAVVAVAAGLAVRAAGPSRSGIDRTYVAAEVRPQDDLFRHVNGKWLAEAVIPPDRPLDGAFHKLREKVRGRPPRDHRGDGQIRPAGGLQEALQGRR